MKLRHKYMNEADAGDTGGAGGGASSGAESNAGAQTGQAQDNSTLLAQGKNNEYIPEKFRVVKEDQSLDVDASSRKLSEAYSALEKRAGGGDLPPAKVEDYTITPPEAFKDVYDSKDPILQDFLKDAHAGGMSQKHVDIALNKYFSILPGLLDGGQADTIEQAEAAVKQLWPDDKTRQANIDAAYAATEKVANIAGVNFEEIEKAGLGNNPTFIKIMAALNKEFKEDKLPSDAKISAGSGGINSEDAYKELLNSPEYLNAKDPKHDAAVAKAKAWRAKTHPDAS